MAATPILPPASEEARTSGLSLWLPSQDAQRLATLAKEYGISPSSYLTRVIGKLFRERRNK